MTALVVIVLQANKQLIALFFWKMRGDRESTTHRALLTDNAR